MGRSVFLPPGVEAIPSFPLVHVAEQIICKGGEWDGEKLKREHPTIRRGGRFFRPFASEKSNEDC